MPDENIKPAGQDETYRRNERLLMAAAEAVNVLLSGTDATEEIARALAACEAEDKRAAMESLLDEHAMSFAEAGYMGDDVVDLMVMRHVGLSISVPESPQLVREHSDYVTKRGGGYGAVREACELVMAAQGTLDAQLAHYLK